MTRYRKVKNNSTTGTTTPTTANTGIPDPSGAIDSLRNQFAGAGSKGKTINYIWMPDKDGTLTKRDAALVKKSFARLSKRAQSALAEYLISQGRTPTDAARKTAFNSLVDAAVESYKQGRKETPWDVLSIQIKNAPAVGGPKVAYTIFDRAVSDALLRGAARELGFNFGEGDLPEDELNDFLKKIQEASKKGGKVTQTIVKEDGTTEEVTMPATFNADSFARNYLWAKVNIGDAKTLPSTVIDSIDALKAVIKSNGLDYLSDKEIANYAVQLAKGELKLTDLQKQFNAKAAEIYPLFADRLKANPNLTVMDVAEPYVQQMAKWWEIDPTTIDLSNPDLDKFLRPDGTAGKVPMGSVSEFVKYLKTHPNAEKTTWANDEARELATGFARMAGFGV